ncbi:MAG: PEP-CTERM sorting domain-containing protein [Verrucomicrobiia bacterium]
MNIQNCLSGALALTLTTAVVHGAEVFSYSDAVGASIQFNGSASTFQFDNNPSNGDQWSITGESGGTGSALNLQGAFSGGPWTIGAITSSSGVETANINTSPSAMLTINDGAGYLATASVVWGQIYTYAGAGGLNADLTVNLSNLAYSGANVDLLNFFSASAGELNLTFQFDPAMTLSQLTAGSGPYTTSFSGSLTPVPEPGIMAIFGFGSLLFGRRLFKK